MVDPAGRRVTVAGEEVQLARPGLARAGRVRCKLREAGADGFVVNCRERDYRLWGGDVARNGGPPE